MAALSSQVTRTHKGILAKNRNERTKQFRQMMESINIGRGASSPNCGHIAIRLKRIHTLFSTPPDARSTAAEGDNPKN